MSEIKHNTVGLVITSVFILTIIAMFAMAITLITRAISKSKENMTGASAFVSRKKKRKKKPKCWPEEQERDENGRKRLTLTCPAFKGQFLLGPGDEGFDPNMSFWKHFLMCESRLGEKWEYIKRPLAAEDAIVAHFQNRRNQEKFKKLAEPYFTPGGAGGVPKLTLKRAWKKGVKYLKKIDAVNLAWKRKRQFYLCLTNKCKSCMFQRQLDDERYKRDLFRYAVDTIGVPPVTWHPSDP